MRTWTRSLGGIFRCTLLFTVGLRADVPPPGLASLVHGFDRMEVESGEFAPSLEVIATESGQRFLDGWNEGGWVGFKRVAFETGARTVEAHVHVPTAPATFSVRVGSPEGAEIGRLSAEAKEGWQTVEANVWRINGLQPIYLVLSEPGEVQVDWIRFRPEETVAAKPSAPPAAAKRSDALAEDFSEPTIWKRLEAEDAVFSDDLAVRQDGTEGAYLARMQRSSWVMYPKVQYNETTRLRLRVANRSAGDRLLIRLDDRHGEAVGEVRLPSTSSLSRWHTVEVTLTNVVPGEHDTYVEFSDLNERVYSGVPWTLLEPGPRHSRPTSAAHLNWIAVDATQVPEASLQVAR